MVMKMNDIQFRKFFLNIVNWSELKTANKETNQIQIQYRKQILAKLVVAFFSKLGSLFTNYFTFVFEGFVAHLKEFKERFSVQKIETSTKQAKRKQQPDNQHLAMSKTLSQNIILSFKSLFENDSEGFLDTQKFDVLTNPLIDLYEVLPLEEYDAFVAEFVMPCVVKFFDSVKDDYKLKSLNYNVISK